MPEVNSSGCTGRPAVTRAVLMMVGGVVGWYRVGGVGIRSSEKNFFGAIFQNFSIHGQISVTLDYIVTVSENECDIPATFRQKLI